MALMKMGLNRALSLLVEMQRSRLCCGGRDSTLAQWHGKGRNILFIEVGYGRYLKFCRTTGVKMKFREVILPQLTEGFRVFNINLMK